MSPRATRLNSRQRKLTCATDQATQTILASAHLESLEARRLLSVVRPDHIVIVIEQDRASDQIKPGSVMPYLNSLAATGLFYNNSHGVTHPTEPNTLALYSGSTQGITGNGRNHSFTGPNLAKSLFDAGFSLAGFTENLPPDDLQAQQAGDANYSDLYTRNTNAMAQFTDVGTLNGSPRPNSAVNKTFGAFTSIPTNNYSSLPTVSFIVPNNMHSTHGSNEAYPWAGSPDEENNDLLRGWADSWLQTNIDPYLQWAKNNNSLLIVTQDEERWTGGTATTITTVVNGDLDLFRPGVSSANINHYNVLRTIEDMYSLPLLGSSATANPLPMDLNGLLAADKSTVTSLSSSVTSSVFGESVTLTAAVSAVLGAAGGNVTFKDGATVLGTAAVNGSGVATLATSKLSVASHSLTAVYGGDATHDASTSSPLTLTVNRAATTTKVTSSSASPTFGQTVTFTATVAAVAPGSGLPSGTVTFKDGATTLGTGTITPIFFGPTGSAVATFKTSSLSAGAHSITAVYGTSASYSTSTSSVLSQTVNVGSTTTTLGSSASTTLFGQSIALTATVTAVAPAPGTPSGSVTFKEGATTIGTATLNGSGIATLNISTLGVGSHTINAVYSATTNFAASTSSSVTQTVYAASTSTAVSSSGTPSGFGQSVTFTATVTPTAPGGGIPGGTVTFFDGQTSIGTGTLNGSGVATLATTALSSGAHSITASYGGSTSHLSSTSSAITQNVNAAPAATSTALGSSGSTVFGQSVTFTATVTSGGGTPTGSVTFKDGATTLGTGTLNGSGVAIFSTSALSVASHSITAVYGGAATFATSTSSALTQSVAQASTTTAVTTSGTPSTSGQSVTFTATVAAVAPGSGIPSGSVNFKDGASVIGSGTLNASGVATFATSSLSAASHSITAVYVGSSNFATSTSSAITQNVNAQGVTAMVLINCDTQQPVPGITLSATGPNNLNLATLPPHISLRADTTPATVGSVRFGYDANSNQRTENTAPYFLNGDFIAFTFTVGTHTVTATPFSAINAGGTVGTALTLTLNVTNSGGKAAKGSTSTALKTSTVDTASKAEKSKRNEITLVDQLQL